VKSKGMTYFYDLLGITIPQISNVSELLGVAEEVDEGLYQAHGEYPWVFMFYTFDVSDAISVISTHPKSDTTPVHWVYTPYPMDLEGWLRSTVFPSRYYNNKEAKAFWSSVVDNVRSTRTSPVVLFVSVWGKTKNELLGVIEMIKDYRSLKPATLSDIAKIYEGLFPPKTHGTVIPIASFETDPGRPEQDWANMFLRSLALEDVEE